MTQVVKMMNAPLLIAPLLIQVGYFINYIGLHLKNTQKINDIKFVTLTKIDLSDNKITPRYKRGKTNKIEHQIIKTLSTKSSKHWKGGN